jgi:KUP system potassium uptake protein
MRADTAAQGRHLASLSLGALGVVFGDIGTSPLYALRECFRAEHGLAPTPANVLGLLSLIIWSLVLVVSVKYVAFVMRADNRGEGGILALLALTSPRVRGTATVTLGLFGAALLYGDGVITPAISVLAAVEGIKVVAPPFTHWVVPVAIGLLLLLFTVQKRGTARMGRMFGPVMLVWFAAIAILGGVEVARSPDVLWGLNPWHAARFLLDHGLAGFLVLGAVVLAITGVEALYADMGHFGRRPIRRVWSGVVLPALVLNYLGQGALILRLPEAVQNLSFAKTPSGWQVVDRSALIVPRSNTSGRRSSCLHGVEPRDNSTACRRFRFGTR